MRNKELLKSSDRNVRIVMLPSEEDATSLWDSRFKLKELRQSNIGKTCSREQQAYIDLVDEFDATLEVGMVPD